MQQVNACGHSIQALLSMAVCLTALSMASTPYLVQFHSINVTSPPDDSSRSKQTITTRSRSPRQNRTNPDTKHHYCKYVPEKKKYSTHCQVEQSCALPSFQSLNHKPQEEKKRHQQIRTGQLTFALLEGYPPHQPLYQTRSGTQLLRWGSKQTHVLARRKVEKREKKTGKMERYGNNGVWQIRLNHN